MFIFLISEPRKEKTDVSSSSGGSSNSTNSVLSPNNEQSCQGALLPPPGGGLNNHLSTPKLERPNSLGGSNKISRRVICYRGDHCKFFSKLL